MMRRLLTTAVAVAALVLGALGPDLVLQARGTRTYLRILGVTLVTTPDGIRMKRATNAQVTDIAGREVGRAWLTSFEAHPGLEYLPSVIEIASGGTTTIIGGLTSANGRFRQTLGYTSLGGSVSFYRANFVPSSDAEYLAFLDQLSAPGNETVGAPSLPVSYSHAFRFTQNRVDRQIGDTGLTFRPGNQWFLSPAFGQLQRVGDNPSMGFTNLTTPPHFYNVNYLRLPGGESGGIVVCVGSPATCAIKGVGDFDGFYGRALSLGVGTLGVTADAASETVLTVYDSDIPANTPGCPAILPAPQNLLAADDLYEIDLGSPLGPDLEHKFSVAWDSVECATGYVLRFYRGDGTTFQIPSSEPFFTTVGGLNENLRGVAVAAVGPNGVVGIFSERFDFVSL
jgi:hypothetical protein